MPATAPPPDRIALDPRAPGWVRDRVTAAGATIVDAREAAALVWLSPGDVAGLRATIASAPQLRWVQLPVAGVENMIDGGVFTDERLWTCGKGVYAEEVAEHALALALAGLRCVPDRVRARSWGQGTGVSLLGERVAILGGGGICESLLRLLGPFGCDIAVMRRDLSKPMAGVARLVGPDAVLEAVDGALVVFVALSLTPATTAIIHAGVFARMRNDAWLINVARGRHVVTDDLVDALRNGTIGGAGIDVTDPEPLPDGHPLWELPNVIITPHTANTPEMAIPPLGRRIEENIRRFIRGDELIGPVDINLGY